MFLPLFLFSIISIHVGECSCKPLVNCRDFWYARFFMSHLKSQRQLVLIFRPTKICVFVFTNAPKILVDSHDWLTYNLHVVFSSSSIPDMYSNKQPQTKCNTSQPSDTHYDSVTLDISCLL